MAQCQTIPVIDLFAGPGGLGEGFSSVRDRESGTCRFQLRVSIEKDSIAHRTLSLRALFRAFPKDEVPEAYYRYVRGEMSREDLFKDSSVPPEAVVASNEAKKAELGKTPHEEIDDWIGEALDGAGEWVLIGGPPCQAYSLAGRSRRTKESQEKFESDEKHFLYKEYLRIIQAFQPTVFVMENVKGILSSTHSGSGIFGRILADLSNPGGKHSYQLRSFVVPGDANELDPQDFVIQAERFGIPQARHRVILFGIRADVATTTPLLDEFPERLLLTPCRKAFTVEQALSGLPAVRSRLSKERDSHEAWLYALAEAADTLSPEYRDKQRALIETMKAAGERGARLEGTGAAFVPWSGPDHLPTKVRDWYLDGRLGGVLQHESRSHMRSDLHRYLFASSFAKQYGYSPKIQNFPPDLLPAHGNVSSESVPFADRFRVQMGGHPSTTVVAHIAKDGHYYIHYDPSQCRSLTVREAARLQTFPDNYFFEGNRTQQYTQIGNAVPPLLAREIATLVSDLIAAYRCAKSHR
jgi:DNA (cytosine-5)-methyltransferase 1